MQRYNEPAEQIDSPSRSILDSPSSRSPRRSLRQATARADSPPRSLRQATLLDSSAASAVLSREEDASQLRLIFSTLLDLVREDIDYEEARTDVYNLEGHQDLKDMVDALRSMDVIGGIRQLADMLDLVQNKREALEALDQLESATEDPVDPVDPVDPADAATDVEPVSDSETESEEESDALGYDSDDLLDLMESEDEWEPPAIVRRRIGFDEEDSQTNSAPLRF